MLAELRDILLLDIETVALKANHHELDERFKAQWARKASFLKREGEETDEDMFGRRAGIYAEFGKVICICVGKFVETEAGQTSLHLKSFADHDEKKLLEEFRGMLEKRGPNTKLCAHNGKEFDFPYLSRRMMINGVKLPPLLNLSGRKPWDVPHLDTLEMWKFGDHKHYTSLDLLAAIFNIQSSKGDMDGSRVNEVYYKEDGLQKIKEYCLRDVVVLGQLFLKLKEQDPVQETDIFYV